MDTITYRAINLHMMTYWRDPITGGIAEGASLGAWHADTCHCQGEEPIPDW